MSLNCVLHITHSGCVKGAKHSFRRIILYYACSPYPLPLFPTEFIHRVMWYSGHPLLSKNITNVTCTLASTWVWGEWKYCWQGAHRSFFLIMPGNNTHFNEEHALYFTLYHASKRKPPWACQAQEVIGFRAVCANCLSKIFLVLMTSSCYCWCLWRVYNFFYFYMQRWEKVIGDFKRWD